MSRVNIIYIRPKNHIIFKRNIDRRVLYCNRRHVTMTFKYNYTQLHDNIDYDL